MAAKYKIVRSINRGGMAEVFEGVVQGVGTFARRVAIKRLLHYQSPAELAAFADEARLVAQLDHPNIVSVFDYGAVDGQPFQVLELVDGLDLKELVELGRQRTYPVPIEAALLIVAQVARALDYAHRAADSQGRELGIVHRDVTPHNILVSWAGHVKLADFGIAMAKDRGAVTEPGIVKGKLSFMAPEYLLGGAVTRLVDVFALGCVLHFAIAGVSPYGTEEARRNGARGIAAPIDPSIPDDVARLVTRACHPIPEQRCSSAIDLAVAVEKTLARRAGTGAMRT
ncbi:MAG: serine/threonine-protein kinase, partial [Myxococcota bacterium]